MDAFDGDSVTIDLTAESRRRRLRILLQRDNVEVVSVEDPNIGEVTDNGDGTITYTPGQEGRDKCRRIERRDRDSFTVTFQYTVRNTDNLQEDTGTITITVTCSENDISRDGSGSSSADARVAENYKQDEQNMNYMNDNYSDNSKLTEDVLWSIDIDLTSMITVACMLGACCVWSYLLYCMLMRYSNRSPIMIETELHHHNQQEV